MSQASGIPNLNTLRGSLRPGGRGRGRGRGATSEDTSNEDSTESKDTIVQQTDNDASVSRMSAVEVGYLEDEFAKPLLQGNVARRYPIINRGTYVRTTAIDLLVDKFLATYPEHKKQIISLGAGSDTRYFRITSNKPSVSLVYHELDFQSNTTQKVAAIQRSTKLLKAVQSLLPSSSDLVFSVDDGSLHSPTYNIHPLDLRTLISESSIPALPNLNSSLPTLILSECCLIYLTPTHADAILNTLTRTLVPAPTPVSIIIYEPIHPHDAFGRVMVSNLAARGIVLQTLNRYSSRTRQKARLRAAAFSSRQMAADVDFIWERWVSNAEKDRVAGLEMLDEIEEWRLLAQHYCVTWGWRDGDSVGSNVFNKAWEDVLGQERDDEVNLA
ncbi:hypothetical protein LTS18_004688 [Coniosporium uncinatum]|uniref:Uncharacterized protein n=1 Tax=Coniosporium uncinatum TaxID=93489 RepID=A0ACC3DYJ0_9PEZI|nr:hypothetical protein LTS18_004688 [Coniosporium uncinatum]